MKASMLTGAIATVVLCVALAYMKERTVAVISDVKWSSFTGDFSPNTKLSPPRFSMLGKGFLEEPETAAFDSNGTLYASTKDGFIWKVPLSSSPTEKPQQWIYVGGRPTGIRFDQHDNLWVAEPCKGLLRIDVQTQLVEIVSGRTSDGVRIAFIDDVDVSPDGMVYFSDALDEGPSVSSTGVVDTMTAPIQGLLSGFGTGRLIKLDPQSRQQEVLLTGLHMANGIAVAKDGTFVLVCETNRFRVRRYWLKGEQVGQSDIFLDGLPGAPDGVSTAPDGTFWIALFAPISSIQRYVLASTIVRQILVDFPLLGSLLEIEKYGHVVHVDSDGHVLESLQDPSGEVIFSATSVVEFNNQLFIGSLSHDFLGIYNLMP